jgi:hypothetical protein
VNESIQIKGVQNGLLPLKLNTGFDGREIDRATLLLRSLIDHWKGDFPFEMHLVSLDEEVDEIKERLSPLSCERLAIKFYSESDFFPSSSAFFRMKGMYKQQVLKLAVPAKLDLGPFITFDADVISLRDFNNLTFMVGNKILSTWEPRNIHSWWQNSMVSLRAWGSDKQPGLGVTPNILHSDICASVFRYMELRGLDPLSHLQELSDSHPELYRIEGEGISLAWSEYSLYTLVGEWFGTLSTYHVIPEEAAKSQFALHSRRNVWSRNTADKLVPDVDDVGYFLIVQSWAGVSVEDIIRRIKVL